MIGMAKPRMWNPIDVHIRGFGKQFNNYTVKECMNFCSSLAIGGLRQDDIFAAVMQKISKINQEDYKQKNFKYTYLPLMQNMMELAMVKSELWYELIDTIKDSFRNHTLEDLVLNNVYPSQKMMWLHHILALELEQEMPWVSPAFRVTDSSLVHKVGR